MRSRLSSARMDAFLGPAPRPVASWACEGTRADNLSSRKIRRMSTGLKWWPNSAADDMQGPDQRRRWPNERTDTSSGSAGTRMLVSRET